MKKKKVRIILQSLFLSLIAYVAIRPVFDNGYAADFEAYCPFGGLSSLFSKAELGTMSCQMSEVQVIMGLGLIAGVLIFGKLFCSYVCPIGTITEWLGKLGDKMKIRMEMPKYLDKPLRSLKYILLFVTIYFTMTASELFCKEFDPYFASAYMFGNSDTVLMYAIPAFIITILGAIVFRLFWCKYLCPLGAISNIFMNVFAAGGVILLFFVLNALGAELSYVWLLAGIVASGFITEVFFGKSFGTPFAKVVRTADTCTDCGLCSKNCPQGIDIVKYEKINHIDCNLCSDCIHSCPVKQSLKINNKKTTKYLAPVATILLIAVSLGFSDTIQFTTISERWGGFENIQDAGMYERSGLKNVKCYGSAMSLKSQLEHVEGIHGIDAYAASHTVKIYYDKDKLSETDVVKTLFTPVNQKVRNFKSGKYDSLEVWETGIYHLFDRVDYVNMVYALRETEGLYGFATHFGEPIQTDFYYDPELVTPEEIRKAIEVEEIVIKSKNGETTREVEFETDGSGVDKGKIAVVDYNRLMFSNYDQGFNKFSERNIEDLSVLVYPMAEADHPMLRRKLPYLMSHISKNDGILKLSTRYLDQPVAIVYFDPQITTLEDVQKTLSSDTLKVSYRDGTTKPEPNPFKSKPEGEVFSAAEFLKSHN